MAIGRLDAGRGEGMKNIINVDALTMTSLEIVDVINLMRKDGKAELRHDTFLVKVKKVLGDTHQNFLASYVDSTGRTLKCYRLPKREASLMVMSESYAVQAKVYDRMTELETRVDDKRRLRHVAASSYKLMSEVLQIRREMDGKKSAPYHFMNEARLINHAITGEFKGLDRDGLSTAELDVLGQLEIRNSALIATGHEYQQRKTKILAYVAGYKITHPGTLQLGGA